MIVAHGSGVDDLFQLAALGVVFAALFLWSRRGTARDDAKKEPPAE